MLEIKDLVVNSLDSKILKGVNLNIEDGSIHVIMGPNGAGKSTICKSLMHHPAYIIESGQITFHQEDITNKNTSDIAKLGIYYVSQTPIEIEGITNAEMLRTSMLDNNIKMDIFAFNKKCSEVVQKLDLPKSFLHRNVNEGMSGGERKKNELLGMWLLEPKVVILDEIDSGLDVDALKVVCNNIREYHEKMNATIILITHQQKLIEELKPNYVHVVLDGVIKETGGIALAKEIEKNGFNRFYEANNVNGEKKYE